MSITALYWRAFLKKLLKLHSKAPTCRFDQPKCFSHVEMHMKEVPGVAEGSTAD